MREQIAQTIAGLAPEVTALRHELHAHPEVHFAEEWTSDRIVAYLGKAGIACKRGYAKGTGVVAFIEGRGEKTVALRADIDALEIQERTGLPYASTEPNRMHACGHDGHAACLCGAARILALHRDDLPGSVRCIFQPGEESAGGGRLMVEEGVLEGVDAVFALHAWPATPVGHVGIRDGTMMATAAWFRIDVRGEGCHGADPAAGADPIVAAAHIITALQTISSRELEPTDAGVVTVGRVQAGTAANIIPDTAVLDGTIRALTEATADRIGAAVRRIATHVSQATRTSATVTVADGMYPPTINDPAMAQLVRDSVTETLGRDRLVEVERPSMTSEDFSFYLERAPGAFIWLGNGPEDGGPCAPLHSARFDFNDAAIPTALTLLTDLAFRSLTAAP